MSQSLKVKALGILACPVCKGLLQYDRSQQELLCRFDKLAFPIKDQIPIMLVDQARKITQES